ncbi:hypothetical protein ACFQHV_18350 [Promicromonospora thailandica]|uniref:Response regulator receiver domain-containing protein n=1 Tax=Promicromonospora thailandica TaxID=765201 RepID=A0A9X2G170_9MICO|nr:hypothetical protein [Promicromonospora thailandica]MCP2265162.1 Response regulator receiver domain-containing protein [Promicromonospora thailandica]BFF19764.1 response regulator [Promicromonospora thailandica]
MSAIAALIGAVASLLWPLLVIVVLLVFGGQLLAKLRHSDDVTLEIGGQRLSIRQAADQQADMISDLQLEVASLKRRLDATAPPVTEPVTPAAELATPDPGPDDTPWGSGDWQAPPPARRVSPATPSHSILWVDDHPENNAMLAETWRRDGVPVDTALSTDDALRLLGERSYALIISDLGRVESGAVVPDAGLRLLTQVRTFDPVTPFVLYGNTGPYADDARAAGVTLVTRSTFDLVEYVSQLGLITTGA